MFSFNFLVIYITYCYFIEYYLNLLDLLGDTLGDTLSDTLSDTYTSCCYGK